MLTLSCSRLLVLFLHFLKAKKLVKDDMVIPRASLRPLRLRIEACKMELDNSASQLAARVWWRHNLVITTLPNAIIMCGCQRFDPIDYFVDHFYIVSVTAVLCGSPTGPNKTSAAEANYFYRLLLWETLRFWIDSTACLCSDLHAKNQNHIKFNNHLMFFE